MAELADAADLKSAGLKRLVGVRVPLSAPTNSVRTRQVLIAATLSQTAAASHSALKKMRGLMNDRGPLVVISFIHASLLFRARLFRV